MPALAQDSDSDVDVPDAIPAKAKNVKNAQPEDDDDDEEGDEEEYQVEKIEGHNFQRGKVIYKIKWLGYEDEDDKTWEPKENLEGAQEALDAYHATIGGEPEPPAKGKKASKASLGKRSSSAAGLADSPAPSGKKKGRKSDANGTGEWEPPVGSWEDYAKVAAIVEEEDTLTKTKDIMSLQGLLEWNNGRKTQHSMPTLRQKCPQRLLDYYESHLLKPKLDALNAEDELD